MRNTFRKVKVYSKLLKGEIEEDRLFILEKGQKP